MQDHPTSGGPIEIKRTVGAMWISGLPHDSLHVAGLLNIPTNTRSLAAKCPFLTCARSTLDTAARHHEAPTVLGLFRPEFYRPGLKSQPRAVSTSLASASRSSA